MNLKKKIKKKQILRPKNIQIIIFGNSHILFKNWDHRGGKL